MASRAMGRAIPAPVVRFVIGADGIVGANPEALQCAPKDMREPGSSRDESAERPLGAGTCSIDQCATAVEFIPSSGSRPGRKLSLSMNWQDTRTPQRSPP